MKTIETADRVSNKAGQDVNSNHGFEQPAPQAAAYWTLLRGDDDWKHRDDSGVKHKDIQRLPHEGLCNFRFDSPAKLLAELLSKGWKKDSFDGTGNRFAFIEASAKGITVTAFESYQAACHAHALSVH